MTLMTDNQFNDFFETYAGNVEGFYEASYWRLADELIKELIRRHIGPASGDRVLDAGGGTGRWGAWLADEFHAKVTVADKSAAMLAEAQRQVPDGVRLVHCDLEDAPELADAEFDAVISTYGVLSFLDDPTAAFATLARVLRPGATGLLMSHSLSNALSSKACRDGAGAAELRALLETHVVQWSPTVPPLRVYSSAELTDLATGAGFEVQAMFGVTSIVHPGPEDFGYPYHGISAVSRALADETYFRTALDLELAASEQGCWAERGTNLMIKVRKPT
ncbi:class I SAM-dependent methyltransferase [Plantactinospora soyae]|uniref:SAM-dependent methyltransferase n=1 Tax=Plantactinospora soyae TaxID=1544732 RepID=A0A927R1A2_9ACTN|nr:class I SAM-dependent methyltransferase [Plantactinospora soyae]MBE1489508.1 SAM-dependent methyltransferase [Plantactinospora soyae]